MLFAVLVLLVLAGTWLTLQPQHRRAAQSASPWSSRAPRGPSALGLLGVVAAQAPLALVAWPLSGLAPVVPGDARSHATVVHWLGGLGAPHGWIEAYQGGFPLGVTYPPLGWLSGAALAHCGMSARTAVHLVGMVSVSSVPVLVYCLLVASRARPCTALLTALFVAWQAPIHSFYGGHDAYFRQGLLSQSLCIPFVVLAVYGVFRKDLHVLWGTLPSLAAVASHPQVTIPALAAVGIAVVCCWDGELVVRYLRVAASAVIFAVALYGFGVASLSVPFGWPPLERWTRFGFGTSHLGWWFLDGEVLDYRREVPVLTAMAGASVVVALLTLRHRASRGALAAALAVLGIAVSGLSLAALGAVGAALLAFFQPVRAFCLLPLAAAGVVAVALERVLPWLDALLDRRRSALPARARVALGGAAGALLLAWVAAALPVRFRWAEELRQTLVRVTSSRPCGRQTPTGYDSEVIRGWLSQLEGGRLWYDDSTGKPLVWCALLAGFELDSRVPVAMSNGAGGHVGIHSIAFHALAPERAGADRRADALGVRYALFLREPPRGDGWQVVSKSGDVGLARTIRSTGSIGVGCVRTLWQGTNASIHEKMLAELETPLGTDRLLDPSELIEIRDGVGNVAVRSVEADGCRIDGAQITEVAREPGAHEAWVDTVDPVDVVIRAAAFPTWKVRVDGQSAHVRKVGPGFLSTRVGAGRHHVEATVSPPPGYLAGIVGAIGLGIVGSLRRERWRALARWARRRRAG
jgi:hypothetical protein